MNIDSWKGCISTPDRRFLNRVLLRSDENYNKRVLKSLWPSFNCRNVNYDYFPMFSPNMKSFDP